MSYFWTCPYCGANLDPGEKCDCLELGSIARKHHKNIKRISNYMEEINYDFISD